jgi:hypothetical protein
MIVRRSFGCGAWDSDFPIYHYYKVVPATPLFNIVTDFDTTKLDRTLWQKYVVNSSSSLSAEEKAWEKTALEKAASEKAKADKSAE